ncbi:serine/threonine-protein kinase [Pseudonocardia nematodicida]|uniref:non-specific serine/threonine protein kinase n=1 Tax=Pseudonocardia nematodicida TaxID=1206997 RepID=A0ABV1K823_9PSEU
MSGGDLPVGAEFGDFEIRGRLGAGGMGVVFRAYDNRHGGEVALKVLPAHLATDRVTVERFRREARAAFELRDPHVVPVHGYGEVDGRLYLSMRLIDGEDLARLLARKAPLPPRRAAGIVRQAAHALDAAHAAGMVHRDVKPANLLVVEPRDDFTYLVDFGIARAVGPDPDTALTATGATVGTLGYLAPERLTDTLGPVDGRADVYSLACVLVEMLTGRPPFVGSDPAVVLSAHLMSPPPRITELAPGLDPAWDTVVARGMAKSPDERFAHAGELAAAAARAAGVSGGTAVAGGSGVPGDGADGAHGSGGGTAAGAPAATPGGAGSDGGAWSGAGSGGGAVSGGAGAVRAPAGSAPASGGSVPGAPPPTLQGPGHGERPPTWILPQNDHDSAGYAPAHSGGPSRGRGLAIVIGAVAVAAAVLVGVVWAVVPARGTGPDTVAVPTITETPSPDTPGPLQPAGTGEDDPAPTTAPTPAFDPMEGDGDLGLDRPVTRLACTNTDVVIVGAGVDPARYPQDVQEHIDSHPGSNYLRALGSCTSFRPRTPTGELIYVVYLGPFTDRGRACEALRQAGGDSYIQPLGTAPLSPGGPGC